MTILCNLFLFILLLVSASFAKEKDDFRTSHTFRGAEIDGQLQQGRFRRIVVEDDKTLQDLLGVRQNFGDRQADEKDRSSTW